jgi:hypothetical protein
MALDTLAALQASATKTDTFNGAAYDLKTATPTRGLVAVIDYSAATNASGSNAFTFSIDESADNSTWYTAASAAEDVVTLSTTAQAGRIFLRFTTHRRYVRLTVTQVGAGSTPTITYAGWIGISWP